MRQRQLRIEQPVFPVEPLGNGAPKMDRLSLAGVTLGSAVYFNEDALALVALLADRAFYIRRELRKGARLCHSTTAPLSFCAAHHSALPSWRPLTYWRNRSFPGGSTPA